ncbi:hypothetical protein [Thermococcus pacificus]|uniref:Uncharacterized protein n=1 Tax=Thermococcus pacificus TaxID=71998 RepID=A0A218P7P6_9EURY|nr:hypothetical protein [Thermococcus pacificus]ASJ06794.1 hypothetical protein A3L08_05405 [Thermococcus pacificus]
MRGLKIFSLAFFSYLGLSLYANYFDEGLRDTIYSRGFELSMLVLGTVYALAFFAVFALGYSAKIELPPGFLAGLFFLLSLSRPVVITPVAFIVLVAYKKGVNPFRLFPEESLLVSLLIPLSLYVIVGIPLRDRCLRYELVGPLVLAAILAVIGIAYSKLSLRWKTLLLFVYSFLFFLGTFRSLTLLVFLAYFLTVYIGYPQLRKWLVPLSVFPLALVVGMSGGLEAVFIRVGFTFLVFHNLVRLSLPWGLFHGSLLLSNNPRHLVASLFDGPTNYTYFFFGQPIADFGLLGLFEAFLLGMFLRDSERTPESLVTVLSLMIYSIDPGVDAFLLMFIVSTLLFLRMERKSV